MKQWIQNSFVLLSVIITGVVSLNFWIDPLWCFNHHNSLQSHQESFNERQQKINLMYFGNSFNYDGLFLGSSRITIHNPSSISLGKTFNMALDAMRPYEFNEYVEYAKKLNHKDFEYIIIGLDFLYIGQNPNQFHINTYLQNTTSFAYRYKTLISYDTLDRSIKNIKNSTFERHKEKFKTYDINHIAHAYSKEPHLLETDIHNYLQATPTKEIIYDRDNYLQAIRDLKKNNPHTRFIVFTTPLPAPILKMLMSSEKNQQTLKLWLNDMHQEFGPFLHFLYSNPITQNYPNYFVDKEHYTSEVADCINYKILNISCKNPAFDHFGIQISNKIDKIYK